MVAVAGALAFGTSVTARTPTAVPKKSVPRSPACASVRLASAVDVVVPVVVDDGSSDDTGQVTCVPVPAGSTGAQVLAARAKLLRTPAPRYALSGLLCAIDGYPATGCGQQTGSHYAYWAYFHGGSAWSYASDGPSEWQVSPGDVEGWRFEPDGTATPADPPPRAPSAAAVLCPASTGTTTTVASPPSTTVGSTVAVGPAPSGGGGGGAEGASAPTTAVSPRSGTASSSTPPTPATSGSTVAPPVSTTAPDAAPPPAHQAGDRRRSTLAAASRPSGSGGGSTGVVVALVLIVALAGAALVRTRRLRRAR